MKMSKIFLKKLGVLRNWTTTNVLNLVQKGAQGAQKRYDAATKKYYTSKVGVWSSIKPPHNAVLITTYKSKKTCPTPSIGNKH